MKMMAEWFWVDRWMGSSAFLLPMEARGLYREMLSQAWRRGARLPADPDAIKRAVGATDREWNRSWPKIERFWRRDGDSIVNDTQLEVYADSTGRKESKVRGGKARAAVADRSGGKFTPSHSPARQPAGKPAQLPADQPAENQPPSPSPSPLNGPTTTRAKRIATLETQQALREAVTELSELTGIDYMRVLERATSGHLRTGKKRCEPCLALGRISQDHADRTLLDVQTALAVEKSK